MTIDMNLYDFTFNKIMEFEGYFSNDKDDLGGMTFAGISRKYYAGWKGWDIIDNNLSKISSKQLDSETERDLYKLVYSFYKENYWNKIKGDNITNLISYYIIEFGVNIGLKRSTKMAQKVCNLSVDGLIGPHSVKQFNLIKDFISEFLIPFTKEKIKFYIDNVDNRPKNIKYLGGWLIRIKKSYQISDFYKLCNDDKLIKVFNFIDQKEKRLISNDRLKQLIEDINI